MMEVLLGVTGVIRFAVTDPTAAGVLVDSWEGAAGPLCVDVEVSGVTVVSVAVPFAAGCSAAAGSSSGGGNSINCRRARGSVSMRVYWPLT